MKHIQNKVAESRKTLPVAILYSVAVWLAAGLVQNQWWIQFGCFALSVYLMMELNRVNLLIRIFSRMVSVSFILLSMAAVFLFPSVAGGFTGLCFIASLLPFYNSYLDKASPGLTFYTFLCLGIGSIADVHLLWFVPIYWLMMATIVYSLCWRTFFASLIGLLTPYWFWCAWILWKEGLYITMMTDHFAELADLQMPGSVPLQLPQMLILILLIILGITGTVHFLRTSSRDKIRTRQIYYSFLLLGTVAIIFLLLQPQHQDMLFRILIITTSPLIGHFLALTKTRLTNIAFFVIMGAILIITAVNLWMSSSLS